MSNYCQECNKKIDLFFCPKCGFIFEYPPYIAKDEDRKRRFREIISSVVKNYNKAILDIDKATANSRLTEITKKYFNRIAILQKQYNDKSVYELYKDENFPFEKMQELGERCLANECRIVLVGDMKAGKSCLINAILGRDLASVSLLPETASLTRFRHTPQDTIKVTFYNRTEWVKLWDSIKNSKRAENFINQYERLNAKSLEKDLVGREPKNISIYSENELKEKIRLYSSASEPTHFFVKELEIGLKDFNIPPNVVFVDTPGLNDPVSYRSDVTNEYLKKANVVLVLMEAKPLKENEVQFVADLFDRMNYAKKRVYILGTKYDSFSDALNSWDKTKSNWLESLSCSYCYGSPKMAEERLIPVAPYFYTLLKRYAVNNTIDNNFSEKDENDLTNGVNNILGYKKEKENIDSKVLNELVAKYGLEKAFPMYEEMRDPFVFRMNNDFEKLIDFSNIDNFRKFLINTPVKDASKIIIEDIANKYTDLKKRLINSSSSICVGQENAVLIGESDNIKEQMKELSLKISETKNTAERLEKLVKKMTNQIQRVSNKMYNSLNKNI